MAQRVSVNLVDDIDGGSAVETIYFSLDGVNYEIDLGKRNADRLRAAMAAYSEAGRRLVRTTGRGRGRTVVQRRVEVADVGLHRSQGAGWRAAGRGERRQSCIRCEMGPAEPAAAGQPGDDERHPEGSARGARTRGLEQRGGKQGVAPRHFKFRRIHQG